MPPPREELRRRDPAPSKLPCRSTRSSIRKICLTLLKIGESNARAISRRGYAPDPADDQIALEYAYLWRSKQPVIARRGSPAFRSGNLWRKTLREYRSAFAGRHERWKQALSCPIISALMKNPPSSPSSGRADLAAAHIRPPDAARPP
jgi:hypothetical protein